MAADRPAPAPDPVAPVLAVRAREACRILGIGRRLLWSLTRQRLIPHVRLGRAVVYPVDGLRTWLACGHGDGSARGGAAGPVTPGTPPSSSRRLRRRCGHDHRATG